VKPRFERRTGDDVRAAWLLAVIIVGYGAYFIGTHYERAIAQAHDVTESLYRRTVANERIIQEAGMLSRVQSTTLNDLRRVSHETSLSLTTAELVATLDRSGSAFRTRVTELEPAPMQSSLAIAKPSVADTALSATEITIKARGQFRNLIRFVEDLSHHRTLLRISDTQLAIAARGDDTRSPNLDAIIHATLYRLHMPGPTREVRLAADR
jgi:hypothetical protein